MIVWQLDAHARRGIARIASTCATNALRASSASSTRASTLTNTPNRRCSRGPIEPAHAVVRRAPVMPRSVDDARPIPRAARAATRGAGTRCTRASATCTRSGCSTPMICAITPPIDAPTTCARSMPSASSTSIASSAIRTRSYGPGGASEWPVPRLSSAMQRCRRPNAPRCSAQPAAVHAEALDHAARACRRADPTRRTRS